MRATLTSDLTMDSLKMHPPNLKIDYKWASLLHLQLPPDALATVHICHIAIVLVPLMV